MNNYFNRTRAPVTVSLKTGEAALVPPKSYLDVSPEQDGSASLHAMVRRGLLVRVRPKTALVPPSEVVEKTSSLDEDPAVDPENTVGDSVVPESGELLVEGMVVSDSQDLTFPTKQWSKSRLINYARSQGLDIDENWTKLEILTAIE